MFMISLCTYFHSVLHTYHKRASITRSLIVTIFGHKPGLMIAPSTATSEHNYTFKSHALGLPQI